LFAAFAKLIGRGEWINDERFAKNSARVANRSVLEPMIEHALASRNRDEWVELLGSNGIPCAPILDPAEAFHHPQVQALGIFQSPPNLEMPLVSAPWSINGVRPPVRRRAPLLGEDNEAVLGKSQSSPAH
jgi:succinate--hydroxymethylglutarate CoA-transferase